MAKITGMGGVIRGKSGPNVYRISKGVQVMSQYNPNPNNPNSDAQQDRRQIFGSAVKMAKAAYDNNTIGHLFKSVSYSDRNLLVSKILNRNIVQPGGPDKRLMVSPPSLINNWVPGFRTPKDVLGTLAGVDLTITYDIPDDDTTPPVSKGFIVRYVRPEPDMSLDDILVYNVPGYDMIQAFEVDFSPAIGQGQKGEAEIDLTGLPFIPTLAPAFIALTPGHELDTGYIFGCWFFIPLSTVYQGVGLQIEIDGVFYSVGEMSYIYQKPTTP